MRTIQTREEQDKTKKRNQIIIGIVLSVIMLFSTVGYAIISKKDTVTAEKDKGFDFVKQGEMWILSLDGSKNVYFHYLPSEVENVSVIGTYNLQYYEGKPLYFVNNNLASQDILGAIGDKVLRYQDACMEGMNCTNFPVKDCNSNVIIFEVKDDTKVRQDKNCVYISGNYQKGVDAWLYRLLGIL